LAFIYFSPFWLSLLKKAFSYIIILTCIYNFRILFLAKKSIEGIVPLKKRDYCFTPFNRAYLFKNPYND